MTRLAQLRSTLDAGPVPGPWYATHNPDWPNGKARIDTQLGENWGKFGELAMICNSQTADYIAACDPQTVSLLLQERDRLAQELENLILAAQARDNSTGDPMSMIYNKARLGEAARQASEYLRGVSQ